MKALHGITFVLLVIGGLNWGLVAFGINPVEKLLGPVANPATMIVYALVGISALVQIFTHASYCKYCAKHDSSQPAM